MKGKIAKTNAIMNNFDFRKVKDSMVAMNLTWTDTEGKEYIPSQEEIENRAKQLLKNTLDSPTSYCKISSGGLVCRKTSVSVELLFVIESAWA